MALQLEVLLHEADASLLDRVPNASHAKMKI